MIDIRNMQDAKCLTWLYWFFLTKMQHYTIFWSFNNNILIFVVSC